MGLLRLVDSFAPGDRMERDRGVDQFPKCRRILSFRPQRKSRTEEGGWEMTERKGTSDSRRKILDLVNHHTSRLTVSASIKAHVLR